MRRTPHKGEGDTAQRQSHVFSQPGADETAIEKEKGKKDDITCDPAVGSDQFTGWQSQSDCNNKYHDGQNDLNVFLKYKKQ